MQSADPCFVDYWLELTACPMILMLLAQSVPRLHHIHDTTLGSSSHLILALFAPPLDLLFSGILLLNQLLAAVSMCQIRRAGSGREQRQ